MREAILQRTSTRTFKDEILRSVQIKEIKDLLEQYKDVKGPFGNKFEFTFELGKPENGKGKKIGTYGVFKNVPAFIGGVSLDNRNSIIDFGYIMELIVLELTKMGYDTCWIGGTIRRGTYRKDLEPNEVIPAMIAVGHAASKQRWIERKIRKAAESNKRLRFGTLFQYFDVTDELEESNDSRLVDIMHLVQRGPSGSNKQPWRIFVSDKKDKAYVYLERTEGYGLAYGFDPQALDAGISLAHLEIGLKHHNFDYEHIVETRDVFFDGLEYIITYQKKTEETKNDETIEIEE